MTADSAESPVKTPDPCDYSGDWQPMRQQLVADSGGEYLRFVDALKPRYGRVWLDIAAGYFGLVAVVILVGMPTSLPGLLVGVVVGSLLLGYFVAYLQLFLHEASHYNISPSRNLNDVLGDWVIAWQTATSLRRYRPIHFTHHRKLGTRNDTENSYFRPLGVRLIIETLTGVHLLRILLGRERQLQGQPAEDEAIDLPAVPLLRALLIHTMCIALAWQVSGIAGVATWLLGFGVTFPLFATVRQLLEHRVPSADPAVNYSRQDQGAFSRMFGTGPLASTFGGAGFNRHLLHHWEPRVSYTRLADLETYFTSTPAGAIIDRRRTTYARAFSALWRDGDAHRDCPAASR